MIGDMVAMSEKWLAGTLKELGCDDIGQLTTAKCKAPVKDEIAGYLHGALMYMNKQNELIREMLSSSKELKDKLIVSQESVVDLQKQLLESKNDQLKVLQSAVSSTVQESVKAEFKSYSAAVQMGSNQAQPVRPVVLKSVVKEVIEEEDRSRNIMVFGLVEEENEQLGDEMLELFQGVGERPSIVEVSRVGMRKSERVRPVKVTVRSSVIVSQIISKSRKLKNSVKYKSVYISADRSSEQRMKHRLLVEQLKKKIADEPEKRHFIREDNVCSVDKPTASVA